MTYKGAIFEEDGDLQPDPQAQQTLADYAATTTPRAYAHALFPELTDYFDPPPLSHYQATTPIEQQGAGGKIPPNQPSRMGAFLDVATNIGGPEIKGAGMLAKPLLGIFAGVGAKTVDRSALDLAKQMFARGIPREQIWDATGWFQGKDGKWKFEISDRAAFTVSGQPRTVGGKLVHPELFAAYPDLADIKMTYGEPPEHAAHYPADEKRPEAIGVSGLVDPRKEILLHELMHAIQQREGFARGGNVEAIKPVARMVLGNQASEAKINDFSREAYRRLAGEVEARNVETRANLAPEQIKTRYPWTTEDRPSEKQTVIGVRLTPVNHDPFAGQPSESRGGNRRTWNLYGDIRRDPKKLDTLRRLIGEGKSNAEVAKILEVTRNTIAGLRDRLKLSREAAGKTPGLPKLNLPPMPSEEDIKAGMRPRGLLE
jgi:hypothetical protein